MHQSSRAEFSARELGPWTRVVETGLKTCVDWEPYTGDSESTEADSQRETCDGRDCVRRVANAEQEHRLHTETCHNPQHTFTINYIRIVLIVSG